ncbi:conjugal transfer protein TraA [Sphingomonas sp. Leaf24]|uniref:Ti-type conjugative transfer relaxase TraA n=1 Tax=unclassified Sphingomonas TaxID=196159 RepID=UPI0006F3C661|nr:MULTISPECIES: Ti-type conjugative transfer relaxase TraA [unclassified Sphingomonas]KQM21509.1 conjugal transfer protein TraA [Sphingomonas sp. Leaf5]KQM93625.1 conjugal transfer protein TraA [Sphingomonas sp. Leaf24]
MAIYHFSAKIISRANGSSAVASAAYRSGSTLFDARLDRHHDFSNKADVIHSEVLLPKGAPQRLSDRATLWNEVEAGEKRKDAQLAREVEFAIPREMSRTEGIRLARDFVQAQFVDRGMVADLNVHWDRAEDGSPKPHAHVMLAMRGVGPDGFGAKERGWNDTALLQHWREAWSAHVNERLTELGIDARIDHRSYAEQGIALEPQHKIGPAASRRPGQGLEAERIEDHARIARENGDRIIADPDVALDAITRTQATFTTRDLAMFAFRHSDGREQYDRVMGAVRASPELVALGRDGRGDTRFTSREMIATEARLERAADRLAGTRDHFTGAGHVVRALEAAEGRGLVLSEEQRDALGRITARDGLASVIGYAGTGKSAMLGVAREAWEDAGYTVRGAALSGIAAENLEAGSGIASRTIASLEHAWARGCEELGPRDVLVVDEAGMIGTRQMERVLSAADRAGAKVVLVGDPEQLQAIEAGAAFRALSERHGAAEITEIRRQRTDWQRDATRWLATGRTDEAVEAYRDRGMVVPADTREAARTGLVEGWDRQRQAEPGATRMILTHTNAEVRSLNEEARGRLRASGDLGQDVAVQAERGDRQFASGDRIMFLRNERSMGVKNGTLGTVEQVSADRMGVRLDDGRQVGFDVKDYAAVDHGYAATIHKSQGVTVDRTHVLATPGMDRHAAYVALSRHRDGVQLHYGRDDFASDAKLAAVLSRDRAKDMAADYVAGPDETARAFADRREIRLSERVREIVRTVETKARRMFAGFRPKVPEAEPPVFPRESTNRPDQDVAIRRYARAAVDAAEMQRKGLPVLPHQMTAMDRAAEALDRVRDQGTRDLVSAFQRDPTLVRDAAAGNTRGAVRAMAEEARVRADPDLRAGRFMERWRALEAEGGPGSARVTAGRAEMIDGLRHDPLLRAELERSAPELGLDRDRQRQIEVQRARDREQDRGMGR